MVGWLPLSEPNDFINLALQINHPWPFSSKPYTQRSISKTKNKKKINIISLSLSLSLSLCCCVCVCVCICFFFFFLFRFMALSFSLSLSLSLSLWTHNERGCDDGFVDVKSVEDSGIVERGPFYLAGRPGWPLCEFFITSRQPVFVAAMTVSLSLAWLESPIWASPISPISVSLLFCAFLGVKQVDLASFVFILFRLATEKMRENDGRFSHFQWSGDGVSMCVFASTFFIFLYPFLVVFAFEFFLFHLALSIKPKAAL